MRLSTFAIGRVIITLRRIQKSIDRLADIEAAKLQWEQEKSIIVRQEPRKAEIGFVDIAELNERWRRNHPQ